MIDDINKSLLEPVKIRLPDIPAAAFYSDRPPSAHDRPCCWIAFLARKLSKVPAFGSVRYDYVFEVTVEAPETDLQPSGTELDTQLKRRLVEVAFIQDEYIQFYTYPGKHVAEGLIQVVSFVLQESKQDYAKNTIKGELTVRF